MSARATRKSPAKEAPGLAREMPRGHAALVEGLWRAARDDRLAHAFGFFGPAGVGKFHAALHFGRGLFCVRGPGPPCGACGPCKRFAAGTHPDVFVLDPRALGLEQLVVSRLVEREGSEGETLESFLRLRAAEGGRRLAILRDFDRAGPAGQNALLKTFEEPGRGVCLIVESSAPDALLDTVKSRLLDVPFGALARAEAAEVLRAHGLPADEAEQWARWSRGAPGRALELASRGAAELRALVAAVAAEGRGGLRGALARWGDVEATQAGDTPGKRARAAARLVLDLGLEVLRDALRALAGVPADESAHADLCTGEGPLAPARLRGERALRATLDEWLLARQDVDANLAPEAAVERALLALADATGARPRPRR